MVRVSLLIAASFFNPRGNLELSSSDEQPIILWVLADAHLSGNQGFRSMWKLLVGPRCVPWSGTLPTVTPFSV